MTRASEHSPDAPAFPSSGDRQRLGLARARFATRSSVALRRRVASQSRVTAVRAHVYLQRHRQQVREELANVVTHGAGLVLAVGAVPVLVALAVVHGTALHVTAFTIYGVSLVLLYAASTLYHAFQQPRLKYAFRVLDHAAIYLLIAGTYTPVTLVSLEALWGWTLFGIVWTIAVAGCVFKLFFVDRFERLSTALYLAMGWVVVLALDPVLTALPTAAFVWLLAGGLCYSGGVVFFVWERLPYNHAIWHLFVLAGSVCHFVAISVYVW